MRKVLRITLFILGGIMLLLAIAVVWLNTRSGKDFLRNRAVAFLHNKLKTEVIIGNLDYEFPKMIVLENVLFRDQANDTLLSARKLKVDISMLKLINSVVEVQEVYLDGIYANIYRNAPDTLFNYDYIIKAFVKTPTDTVKAVKTADSASKLVMNVDHLGLHDIHLRFDDYTGGSRVAVDLESLDLTMRDVDPEKLIFRAKSLKVAGLVATVIQDTSFLSDVPSESSPVTVQVGADDILLERVSYSQKNFLSKFFMDLDIGRLSGHPDKIDIPNQYIGIKDLALDSSSVNILMAAQAAIAAEKVADSAIQTNPPPTSKWRVLARTIHLGTVDFKMDNENLPRQASGIDYAHLDAKNLNLDANTILYTTDTIAGNITHFAVKEKSGLDVKELKTRFAYYPQGGYLRNLYLQTSKTILQDYVTVRYPSVEALNAHPELIQFELNLKNSIVGMSDVLLFAPQLQQQPFFRQHRNGQIRVASRINGRMDALNIEQLHLSGLGSTEVDLNGKVNGLPDANRLSYNLNIQSLQSSRNDIETLLPAATSKQVRIPDRFGITGTISGTTTNYNPNLLVMTTDGNASVKGNLAMPGGKGRERYDLVVKTQRLHLGHILRDTMLGPISADVVVKGQGFDPNYMNTIAKGTIHSGVFKRYNYQDISFNGKMAGKHGSLTLDANDPNAKLNLTATADLTGKYPAIKADAHIDSIDLFALHLYATDFRLRGDLRANIIELNPDYPNGTIILDKPTIASEGKRYFLDSMYISMRPSADSGNNIVIDADAIKAHIWGHTPLTKIGNIVQSHIDRHYGLRALDSVRAKRPVAVIDVPADYDLNLIARIEDKPVIHGLVPSLSSFDSIKIEGGLTPRRIYLNADAPKVVYNGSTIEAGKVRVNGTDSALTYALSVDRFAQNSIEFWYANASGELQGNSINSNISIADADKKQRFALQATLQQSGSEQVLQLHQGLVLNYKTWQVTEPNRIVFGKPGFYVQNFGIRNGNEFITINSQTPNYNAAIRADISNFMISNITQVISKDTLLANGIIGGNINLQQLKPDPQLSSNLLISNLSVLGDTIGNVNVEVRNATASAIDANVGLTGFGNDIKLSGLYYPTAVNGNNFNMDLVFNPLSIKSVEGLAQHQIKNSSGYLRGNLKVSGLLMSPWIVGDLRTENLSTNIAMLNSQFTMPAEHISFTGKDIVFHNFKIKDSAGNVASIDGSILTHDFKAMELAMQVRARNWQALNSTAKDNKLFYGKLFITTAIDVDGPLTAPNMDGTLNVLKGTSMSVTIPQAELGVQSWEGIVEFVDMSDTNRYKMLAAKPVDTIKRLAIKPGGSMNLNISVDPTAEFSVIIDEGTGDFLRVKGKASLNTSVAPDGTVGLVGTYEIVDGAYQLNYNFIRRLFKIQTGSTIIFSGDPTKAQINITAIYEANTSPYDLVEKQVADPAQLAYYKQNLPFEVRMNLSGELMSPVITFDVVLPEEKKYRVSTEVTDLVQAKLSDLRNDPSELNKQVFALLILNRFVGENPFQNGAGGGGIDAIARQSASRFIGEQLNKFAGGLIQGLDLTMDLASSEDYTTGEKRNRTDLNIAASKRLLNDRLTITVGNNFELEGPKSNNQSSSLIPGNLALDYDLTADGRYKIRTYRRDNDLGAIEGTVTETGVSFIVTADYNRLNTLFWSKKKRERMRAEREKQNAAGGPGKVSSN